MIEGIDISKHNGDVDSVLDRLYDRRGFVPRFVVLKASEGGDYVDPLFDSNRRKVEARGIPWTAYHFARPDNHERGAGRDAGVIEGRHFAKTIGRGTKLRPWLDWEKYPGRAHEDNRAWIEGFREAVLEHADDDCDIYTGKNVWRFTVGKWHPQDANLVLVKYSRGGALESETPDPIADDWRPLIWQWSGGGSFDHVPEDRMSVDYDRFLGDEEDWRLYTDIYTGRLCEWRTR